MLSPYIRNAGYGLTKSSQSLLADSLVLSTRAWRQKGIDSVSAIELNISDTATMLTPYSRGSGTSGQVGYWNATRSLTGSSNLFWDNANGRLGIGTASPSQDLTVSRTIDGVASISLLNGSAGTTASSRFYISNTSTQLGKLGSNYTTGSILKSGDLFMYNQTVGNITFWNNLSTGNINFTTGSASSAQLTLASTGNLLLNTSSDAGYKLDVNGTARVQGQATITGAAATSATNSLLVQNSANLQAIQAKNDGSVIIGNYVGAGKSITIDQTYDINYLAASHYFGFTSGGVGSFYARFNGTSAATASLQIGNSSNLAAASAILDLTSTTKGFLPPRMSTTQKNAISSPATGLMVYDTTLNKLCVFTGTVWETITSL
jgi:hypothetical protein